jgi:hypothetical protein
MPKGLKPGQPFLTDIFNVVQKIYSGVNEFATKFSGALAAL